MQRARCLVILSVICLTMCSSCVSSNQANQNTALVTDPIPITIKNDKPSREIKALSPDFPDSVSGKTFSVTLGSTVNLKCTIKFTSPPRNDVSCLLTGTQRIIRYTANGTYLFRMSSNNSWNGGSTVTLEGVNDWTGPLNGGSEGIGWSMQAVADTVDVATDVGCSAPGDAGSGLFNCVKCRVIVQ